MAKKKPFARLAGVLPERKRAAPILIAAAVFLSLAATATKEFRRRLSAPEGPHAADMISLLDGKSEAIKAHLGSHRVIGYWPTDLSTAEGVAAFFKAQYALAPILVTRGTRQTLVLVNGASPTGAKNFQAHEAFSLVKDFGGGIGLFSRNKQ